MNARALGLGLLLSITALACTQSVQQPRTAAEFEQSAKQAYDEALIDYLDGNWEFARQEMEEVRRNFPHTPYARLAQLRLADIAFRQERYPEAIAQYQAYVKDHPNDNDVSYARFRVIRSQFLSASNTFFQPPLEERDLAAVRDAYAGIRAFSADYPNYPEREQLRYMHQSVSGMLARHELYVARFYLRRDEYTAARRRVQYALRNFQDTGMEPEAVVLLGEIYLQERQRDRARALFELVLSDYPHSPFVVPAQNFLALLDESAAQGSP